MANKSLGDSSLWIGLGALMAWLSLGMSGITWTLLLIGAFLIGIGIVLWQNGEKQYKNWLQSQTSLSMPHSQTGLPKILLEIRNKTKPLNSDKRLTGAGNIDDVLHEILDYVCRDYIRSWYKRINEDTQFEHEVRDSIHQIIIAFSERVKDVDLVPYLTTRFVDDFATHLRLYRRSLLLYREQESNDKKLEMEDLFFDLECEVEKNFCRDLVCLNEADERQYLNDLSEMMLFLLLPPENFHNKIFRYIAREIIVNAILLPAVNIITDPDFVNQMVSSWCKETAFNSESFLTILRTSDSAEEMQAVKEFVDLDIARQRSRDTGGEDDSQIKQQLSSLQYVKNLCEARLQLLKCGQNDSDIPVLSSSDQDDMQPVSSQKTYQLSFDVLLNNNICLNHFIEFMTSIGAQQYIFFYLNVEAYRVSAIQHISAYLSSTSEGHPADLDTLKQLAINIFKQYLSDKNGVRAVLDEAVVKNLWEKIEKEVPSNNLFDEVQLKVFDAMHFDPKFYPAFLRSSKYLQMLSEVGLYKESTGSNENILGDKSSPLNEPRDTVLDISPNKPLLTATETPTKFTFSAYIVRTGVSSEFGKSYGTYQVHCIKTMPDGKEESWDVPRRYSDFHDLHGIISDRYDTLPQLNLPGKKAFNSISPDILEKRKIGFNAYLQCLLNPNVLDNHHGLQDIVVQFFKGPVWDIKKFQQESPILSLRKGVANLMKSVPDSFSEVINKVVAGDVSASPTKTLASRLLSNNKLNSAASLKLGPALDFERYEDNIPLRVMLLLMDEVFDLKNSGNQWIRHRIAILLRQIAKTMFGDSMNRKIVDQVEKLTSAEQIVEYLKSLRDAMWPGGTLAEPRRPRDDNTRFRTRVICKAKMYGTVSDDLQRLIGSETCRRGVILMFSMFQHQKLNRRLVYVVLERLLETLFPDNKFPQIFRKIHERSPRVIKQTKDRV